MEKFKNWLIKRKENKIIFGIFLFITFCTIMSLVVPSGETQIENNPILIANEQLEKTFERRVLNAGYKLKGNLYYTRSKDFQKVYMFGALIEKNGKIYNCVWNSNSENLTNGIVSSLNDNAKEVSGIFFNAVVTQSDDGYSRLNNKLLSDWK